MKYTVLTLFPEILDVYFASSIMAKALSRGIIEYQSVNIRDFAFDKHRSCDDAPYGGGPGMLMLPEPLGCALEAALTSSAGQLRSFAPSRLFTKQREVRRGAKLHALSQNTDG